MKDLSAYVFVNMILAIINWLFSPDFWWVLFPVVFWGIGIFVNFLKTYVFDDYYDHNYRERKIEEEMKKLSD